MEKDAEKELELANAIVLYEQDGVKITAVRLVPSYSNYELKIGIENLTHRDLTFNVSDAVINGKVVDGYLYETINSGKSTTTHLSFYEHNLNEANIESIDTITFSLESYRADNYSSQKNYGPYNVAVDTDGYLTMRKVYTDKETISEVQRLLNEAGYECGTADGVAGKLTNSMILQYAKDHGLPEETDVTDVLLESLRSNN